MKLGLGSGLDNKFINCVCANKILCSVFCKLHRLTCNNYDDEDDGDADT